MNVSDYCGFNSVSAVADNLDHGRSAEMLRYFIDKGADADSI